MHPDKHRKLVLDLPPAGTAGSREPSCPRFDLCTGCDLMHLDEATQLILKKQHLLQILQHMEAGFPESEMTIFPAEEALGYRTEVRLLVDGTGGSPRLVHAGWGGGFVPAAECPALCLPLRRVIPGIEAVLAGPRGGEDRGSPELSLAAIRLFASESRARVVAFLEGEVADARAFHRAARELIRNAPPLAGVVWREGEKRHVTGSLALDEDVGPHSIHVIPPARVEPGPRAAWRIARSLLDLAEPLPGQRVLDLHAGIGLHSLVFSPHVERLYTLEEDEAAVESILGNMTGNELGNYVLVQGDVARELASLIDEGVRLDTVLFKLPPGGRVAGLAGEFARAGARRVIQVTPARSALADVAAELRAAGYRLTAAHLIDSDPQTTESVAVLRWDEGSRS